MSEFAFSKFTENYRNPQSLQNILLSEIYNSPKQSQNEIFGFSSEQSQEIFSHPSDIGCSNKDKGTKIQHDKRTDGQFEIKNITQKSIECLEKNSSISNLVKKTIDKDIVTIHFVFQILWNSKHIGSELIKEKFSKQITGYNLWQIIQSCNMNGGVQLKALMLTYISDLHQLYLVNPKLADIGLSEENNIKSYDNKFKKITPRYFFETKNEYVYDLLEKYKDEPEQIDLLFEYYQKVVAEDSELKPNRQLANEKDLISSTRNQVILKSNQFKNSNIFGTKYLAKYNEISKEKDLDTLIREMQELNGFDTLWSELKNDCNFMLQILVLDKTVKQSMPNSYDFTILVKVLKAAQHIFKFMPRITQILSLLILIKKHPMKGRLLQIQTGEGKTIIIAILAAYQALKGKQVDIVTSSENLAIRDSQQNAPYFQYLGLEVGHIIGCYQEMLKNEKNPYTNCHILYGTAHYFCANLLQDFKLGKELCKRKKDFLIVDEVDNMLIDCKGFITKLSDSGYGLEKLQIVRRQIWITLNTMLFSNGGQIFTFLPHAIKESIIKVKHIFKMSRVQQEMFDLLLDQWIDMAIRAKLYVYEGKDYIIKDKKVIIVDSENTGEMQLKMRWQFGLHDFLEMKHNLPIGKDSFTSLYYSNHRFFTEYESNLCGLTGTFGSLSCRNFLKQIYNVDMIEIPTFKPKKFNQLPSILCSQNEWLQNIMNQILLISSQRPVLVIVKSINEAKEIILLLKEAKVEVLEYIYSDEQNLNSKLEEIKTKIVIVATNLAGRGTDIKLSEDLEKKGGLHVILGYVPKNLRVEQQAFGRTSRKGNPGDGIMIIPNFYFGNVFQSIENLKMQRDLNEKLMMEERAIKEIQNFKLRDDMFKRFCQSINDIDGIKQKIGQMGGLCEQWAEFYISFELIHSQKPLMEQKQLFDEFLNQLILNFNHGIFAKNHIHYLIEADNYLKTEGNISQARNLLKLAKSSAGNTHGLLLRESILENNLGNYAESKKKLFEAVNCFEEYVASRIAFDRMLISASLMNDTVDVMRSSLAILKRTKNIGEIKFTDAIHEMRKNNSSLGQLLFTSESNTLLTETNLSIQQEVTDFQNAANIMQAVLNENEKDNKAIVIKSIGMCLNENATPEIPVIEPKKKPDKKTGFWGFILGGLSIIGGALLALYGSGLLATFGFPLIANGFELIKANFEINLKGNYSNDKLFKQFIINTSISLFKAMNFQDLASIPQDSCLYENIQEITNLVPNFSVLKEIALKTCEKAFRTGSSSKDFKKSLLLTVKERKNLSNIQELKMEMTEAQQQEFVNVQLNNWFKSEIEEPIQKIRPDRIEQFLENLQPIIQKELNQLSSILSEKMDFNILLCAAVFDNEKEEQNKEIFMNYLVSKSYQLKKKYSNPKTDKRVHQVIGFKNFSLLVNIKIRSDIEVDLKKIADELMKASAGKCSFIQEFQKFMKKVHDDINGDLEKQKLRKNALINDFNTFNLKKIGDKKVLVGRQENWNKEYAELEKKIKRFTSTQAVFQNPKFRGMVFSKISDLVLSKLRLNKDWLPKDTDFKQLLKGEFVPIINYVVMFFQESLKNKNSEIHSLSLKAQKLQKSIVAVFSDVIEQEFINAMNI